MASTEEFLRQLADQHRAEDQMVAYGGSTGPWRGSADTGYRGADTKLASQWLPCPTSGEGVIGESWPIMGPRIRDMVRNDQALSKAHLQLVTQVIGTGILPSSDPTGDDGELDDVADEMDQWWDRWAESTEADINGEHCFYDLHRLAFGDAAEVGNSLLVRTQSSERNRTVPLAFQLIEWEQVDCQRDREFAESEAPELRRQLTRVSNGIEYSRAGRKLGIWIYEAHPYDHTQGWTTKSTFVPWSRVIHNYVPCRISSGIGVSWFAPMLIPSRNIDRVVSNSVAACALQALVGMVIKENHPSGSHGLGMSAEDEHGRKRIETSNPMVARIGVDEDIQLIQTQMPQKDLAPFFNLLHVIQAMGSKMSLFRLLGDPSKANFAAIKAAVNDDEIMLAPIVQHQARKIVKPIRLLQQQQAAAAGRFRNISFSKYRRNQLQLEGLQIVPGGTPDLQPKEDGEAATERLRTGRSTYQHECARLGFRWRNNVRQHARAARAFREAGIAIDWTKGNGGDLQRSSIEPAPEEEEVFT